MAKKIIGYIKLQVPAGKANPSPPIGPAHLRAISAASSPDSSANAVSKSLASRKLR